MPILNLKPLIFSLLNLCGLQSPKPELRDIAIALRQNSLMYSLIRTLQEPELLISLQSICKEELPPQLSKISEIRTPDPETFQVTTHPIVTEIFEGKRKVNVDLYKELFEKATTLLDSEYSKIEKYEHFHGNSIQFSLYQFLCRQLEELVKLDTDPQLQSPFFKGLNHLAFDFTDLACIANAKTDNQSQAYPIMSQACVITRFLDSISKYKKGSDSMLQCQDIMRRLYEINAHTLCAVQELNIFIDTLEKQCNSNERLLLLHLLKKTNKIAQELCVRLAPVFKEISLNGN